MTQFPDLQLMATLEAAEQFMELIAMGARLGDILDFEEKDYEIVYSIGHLLYTQRRFAEAEKVFGYLVAHNHTERRYIHAYGATLQMNRDYANAIRLYTLASILDLTDPGPCLNTCECLLAMGNTQDAVEGLEMVIKQCNRDEHAAHRSRAEALLALARAGDATKKDLS